MKENLIIEGKEWPVIDTWNLNWILGGTFPVVLNPMNNSIFVYTKFGEGKYLLIARKQSIKKGRISYFPT